MKIKGEEFKAFYFDDSFWPEEAWHESNITVNGEELDGVENIKPTDEVIIHDGEVHMSPSAETLDMISYFKKWRKKQTHQFITVQIHKDNLDKAKEFLKTIGGKIV